jgi:hypothetical protein
MSGLIKSYTQSGVVFAKPAKAHEFVTNESYKGFSKVSVRPGADNNKKCPSLINGKQVKYKQD